MVVSPRRAHGSSLAGRPEVSGGGGNSATGLPVPTFMGPGLIMMTMAQHAFAKAVSSLMIAKTQGNIVDLPMPPLKPNGNLISMVGGGVARAVGLCLCSA